MERPKSEKGEVPEYYNRFKKPIPPLNPEELEAELGDILNTAGQYAENEATPESLARDERIIGEINKGTNQKLQEAHEQTEREQEAKDKLIENNQDDDDDDYEDYFEEERGGEGSLLDNPRDNSAIIDPEDTVRMSEACHQITDFLKSFSRYNGADITTSLLYNYPAEADFLQLRFTKDDDLIGNCEMLNSNFYQIDFEDYSPLIESYQDQEMLDMATVLDRLKRKFGTDDYFYLPGIELLREIMSEKKANPQRYKGLFKLDENYILPGTLLGLPDGHLGVMGYHLVECQDKTYHFHLDVFRLTNPIPLGTKFIVLRKKFK